MFQAPKPQASQSLPTPAGLGKKVEINPVLQVPDRDSSASAALKAQDILKGILDVADVQAIEKQGMWLSSENGTVYLNIPRNMRAQTSGPIPSKIPLSDARELKVETRPQDESFVQVMIARDGEKNDASLIEKLTFKDGRIGYKVTERRSARGNSFAGTGREIPESEEIQLPSLVADRLRNDSVRSVINRFWRGEEALLSLRGEDVRITLGIKGITDTVMDVPQWISPAKLSRELEMQGVLATLRRAGREQ